MNENFLSEMLVKIKKTFACKDSNGGNGTPNPGYVDARDGVV